MNSNISAFADIYGEFYKYRIIFLNGEINDDLAQTTIMKLLMLDSLSNEDITMYINSPGGSVSAGLAIYDTIQHIESNVSTVGVGMCASMGAFLLMAGAHGKRFVLPHSQILIHQPLGGVAGQATEIQLVAERLLRTRQQINEIIAKHTGQTIERIQADTERDCWMWAEEAIEYGLVDRIKEPLEKQNTSSKQL